MLIQNLEKKTRLALATVVFTVIGSTLLCIFTIFYAFNILQEERNQIYVLDGDIPFLAQRAKLETNFIMEAKACFRRKWILFGHSFFKCNLYDFL